MINLFSLIFGKNESFQSINPRDNKKYKYILINQTYI